MSLKAQYAIVVASFHQEITSSLLTACLDEFKQLGVPASSIVVTEVPGAFEIPLTALMLAKKKNIKAVVCLGAVVRGQTFHYELVAQECARGIQDVSLRTKKPIIFEVLAADTIQLCQKRAQKKDKDNKGASAARVAVAMVKTLMKIRKI